MSRKETTEEVDKFSIETAFMYCNRGSLETTEYKGMEEWPFLPIDSSMEGNSVVCICLTIPMMTMRFKWEYSLI